MGHMGVCACVSIWAPYPEEVRGTLPPLPGPQLAQSLGVSWLGTEPYPPWLPTARSVPLLGVQGLSLALRTWQPWTGTGTALSLWGVHSILGSEPPAARSPAHVPGLPVPLLTGVCPLAASWAWAACSSVLRERKGERLLVPTMAWAELGKQ